MLIKAGKFVGRRWDNDGRCWVEAAVYGSRARPPQFECRMTPAAFALAVQHLNRVPHAFWAELAERPDAEAFVPDFVAAFVRMRALVDQVDALELRGELAQSQAAGLVALAARLDVDPRAFVPVPAAAIGGGR